MRKLYILCSFLCLLSIAGCASNSIDTYLSTHPELSAEIFLAIQERSIINGMSKEQVQLVLGEPDFVEPKSSEKNTLEKWIYRFTQKISFNRGKKLMEEYDLDRSSFPQGIAYIIPKNYNAKEIRIEFEEAQVCRVQKIIAF